MGLTTPFPEPDSPELQRFAVQSKLEVAGLLRTVLDRGVPLNVFFEAGAGLDVMALRQVDLPHAALIFESPVEEERRRRLLEASTLTCVGFVDEAKLQFSVPGACPAEVAGLPAIAMPMPERLFRIERRVSVRVRPAPALGAVCRLPVPGSTGQYETLGVLDIGSGGVALLTHPERVQLSVGMEIAGCRLDLPGVGGATVDLRVRHLGSLAGVDEGGGCGCEFIGTPATVQSMIERYVRQRAERVRRPCDALS
jgi:c-di-GMP-binding flagellar brake protein YcgR